MAGIDRQAGGGRGKGRESTDDLISVDGANPLVCREGTLAAVLAFQVFPMPWTV